VGAGDGRVDVHHEHGAVAAGEDVQVVDEELAGLARQRCVKVMGHRMIHSLHEAAGSAFSSEARLYLFGSS
jgi:hypothetical protein